MNFGNVWTDRVETAVMRLLIITNDQIEEAAVENREQGFQLGFIEYHARECEQVIDVPSVSFV